MSKAHAYRLFIGLLFAIVYAGYISGKHGYTGRACRGDVYEW
jgi:hypothetical protein